MEVTTKICQRCGIEKSLELFFRNKNRPDGTGRSSWCIECGAEDADVLDLVERERKRDWAQAAYYADPRKKLIHDVRVRVKANRDAKREQRKHARETMEALYSQLEKECIECGEVKNLLDFPINKYARPRVSSLDHSNRCWECWNKMPNGKQELARERARDFSAARARAADHDPLAKKRKRKNDRNELRMEALRMGIDPVKWREMTTDERMQARIAALEAEYPELAAPQPAAPAPEPDIFAEIAALEAELGGDNG